MEDKYYFLTILGYLGFFLGIILFIFSLIEFQIIQDVSGKSVSNHLVFEVFIKLVGLSTLAGCIIGLVIDFLLKAIFGIEGYEKIVLIIKEVGSLIGILISGSIGAGLGYGVAMFLHWGTVIGVVLGIVGFFIGVIGYLIDGK